LENKTIEVLRKRLISSYNWNTFQWSFYFQKINSVGINDLPEIIRRTILEIRCHNCRDNKLSNLRKYQIYLQTIEDTIDFSELILCDSCVYKITYWASGEHVINHRKMFGSLMYFDNKVVLSRELIFNCRLAPLEDQSMFDPDIHKRLDETDLLSNERVTDTSYESKQLSEITHNKNYKRVVLGTPFQYITYVKFSLRIYINEHFDEFAKKWLDVKCYNLLTSHSPDQ
jgi:hypothetical protein